MFIDYLLLSLEIKLYEGLLRILIFLFILNQYLETKNSAKCNYLKFNIRSKTKNKTNNCKTKTSSKLLKYKVN